MDLCGIYSLITVLSILQAVLAYCPEDDHWGGWWSYEGRISGPNKWGEHNSDWSICKTGKNQSPINIIPHRLLYDPHLQPLIIETTAVDGVFRNNKRDLTFIVKAGGGVGVNITSGPLSYTYKLYQIRLHYGRHNLSGSEHTIDGKTFAGELQFMAYNSDLYSNDSEAQLHPRGIAVIAVFLQVGEKDNSAFRLLQEKFFVIEKQDTCTDVKGLPIDKLLPRTDRQLQYMTYSGSLTQPGCRETVTWLILNKPTYISHQQMADLRTIPYQEWKDSNARPVFPLNHRTVRTNINFRNRTRLCTMETSGRYEVNQAVGQR